MTNITKIIIEYYLGIINKVYFCIIAVSNAPKIVSYFLLRPWIKKPILIHLKIQGKIIFINFFLSFWFKIKSGVLNTYIHGWGWVGCDYIRPNEIIGWVSKKLNLMGNIHF